MGWTHKEYSCHGPQTIVQTLLHLGPKLTIVQTIVQTLLHYYI